MGQKQYRSTISKNKKKLLLYAPILIVEIFLVATVILYIFGPWDWPTQNIGIFYTLLFLYHFSLGFGYFLGIKSRTKPNLNLNKEQILEKSIKIDRYILRYLDIAILIVVLFSILNFIRATGVISISPIVYLEEIIKGLSDPAQQYRNKFSISILYGGSILSYANVLLSPFLWPVIPLSIYYFKELKPIKKFLVVVLILFESSKWIATGTNKGLFDLAIIIITVLLIKYTLNKIINNERKGRRFFKFRLALILILPILFFISAISDRLGGNIYAFSNIMNGVPLNKESLLMNITPEFMHTGLILLTSYVSQGYYALSMAVTLPFTPMFGVGNSMFLINNFSNLLGIDLFQYTYMIKLEEMGWGAYLNWHTFYVWIANDVSFFGVIIVMFIIGFAYASIWKSVLYYRNPIAIVLMSIYSIMFLYMSSNNQVLSYPTTFTAFWGLTFLWLLTRKKYSVGRLL